MSETNHLPDSGFGKIFETTYTGSLLGSGPVVMSVWPYAIANAKPPGVVELVPRYIATVIGCSMGEVQKAIEFLQSPDPESRSKVEDGRRLIPIGGHLYKIPTWQIYREKRDDEARKTYFRQAKRKSRGVVKGGQRQSKNVQEGLGMSNLSTQAEAEIRDGAIASSLVLNSGKPDSKLKKIADSLHWNGRGWEGITDQDREAWAEAYPACNIPRQLAAASQWLISNPAKAKKKQWRRFLTGWLARNQERGGDIASNRPAKPDHRAEKAAREYAQPPEPIPFI